MSTLPPDVRKLLEEQGILQPQEAGSQEDYGRQVLREIGLAPPEEKEGTDLFQPIRTFFGATQAAIPRALAPLVPTQYEAARAELEKQYGVTPASPWYERVEAAPGLGDVAAQFIPQEVREGRLGTALGPIGRLIGNIAGDPTTYTPAILAKLGGGIAARVPQAAEAIEAAARAEVARRGVTGLSEAAQVAQQAERAREGAEIARRVMQYGTPAQRAIYSGAGALQRAEPIAMGSAAALAYGPAVARGALEGWRQVGEGITEQPFLDTAAEAANAAFQTGLGVLMAKGLISAAEGAARWQRHLAEQRPAEVRAGVEEVGGVVGEAVEGMPRLPPEQGPAPGLPPSEPLPGLPGPEAPPTLPGAEPVPSTLEVRAAGEPGVIPSPEVTVQAPEGPVVAEPPTTLPRTPPEPPAQPAVAREPTPAPPAPAGAAAEVPRAVEAHPTRAEVEAAGLAPEVREFRETDVDSALKAADDLVAQDPQVRAVTRSLFGFGSKGKKGFRRAKAEQLDAVLRDPIKRKQLDDHLNAMAEDAARLGDELDPARVRGLIGRVASSGEVPKYEAVVGEAPTVAPQKLKRAEVGGRAEDIAEAPPAREGAVEAPKATTRNFYDYLQEQVNTAGSALQKAGVRSVRDLAEQLRPALEEARFAPGRVEAFFNYVDARERGLSAKEAIDFVRKQSSQKWNSEQAARNAVNQVARRADELQKARFGEAVARGAVEGRREASPEDLQTLARERQDAISHIESAIKSGDKDELAAGLGAWMAHVERRKLYDLKRDYSFMRPLKQIATDLNAKGDGPKIPASAFKNATQLAEAIARNRGVVVKELAPKVEAKLEPARKEEVARVREKKGVPPRKGRGPGGFEVQPTRPGVPGIRYRGKAVTASFIEANGNVRIEKFDPEKLGDIADDMLALREDSDVRTIDVGDLPNKTLDNLLDPEEGRLPAFIEDPDAPRGRDQLIRMGAKQDRIAEMAAREIYGTDIHPNWATPVNADMDRTIRTNAWTSEAEKAMLPKNKFLGELQKQLKPLRIDFDPKLAPELLGTGTYHVVYRIPGTEHVLRIGKSPVLEWRSPEQRALVQPTLASGKLGEHAGMPINYAVQPLGLIGGRGLQRFAVTALDEKGILSGMLTREIDPRVALQEGRFDPALAQRAEGELVREKALPPGRTLQEYFQDVGDLLFRASNAGMDIAHDVMAFPTQRNFAPWGLRGEQFGYFKVDKLDPLGVGFKDPSGQHWQLRAADNGTLTPGRGEWQKDPTSKQIHDTWRIAMSAIEPETRLSLHESERRALHYADDVRDATPLDVEGLVSGNFDRVASQQFVDRHGELGTGAARALREVVADMQKVINERLEEGEAPMDVAFRGLTSSPYQRGLYHGKVGETGNIYANVVEAVNAARGDYEKALDDLSYTVLHEVIHNRSEGHGASFQSFREYYENILTAEDGFTRYREMLKKEFTQEEFRQISDELVPEFQRMRRAYGNRAEASWREAPAQGVEGVPAGAVEGRAPPVTDQPGRGAEAAAGDQLVGLQPGRAVPGGDRGETGGVRPPAALEPAPAPRPAEGEAAGSPVGRDPLQEVKDRIAEYGARAPSEAEAKKLLDALVEGHKRSDGKLPTHDAIFNWGYSLAGDLVKVLHPKDIEARANSLPYPRSKDQVKGALNMLRFADLPAETKARIQLTWELTKGHWPGDTPQRWDQVDTEVHDMLGLHSPQEWTTHFRNQKGGPTARDVVLMGQVMEELQRQVMRADEHLAHEIATNPNLTPERIAELQQNVNRANANAVDSMLVTAAGGTTTGRALAIRRKGIRQMDPQLAVQQDLRAALRERMRTRFKNDPAKAQKVADELFGEFWKQRMSATPDWEAFQKAYRAVLGSKVWPEKILEWYKAGLLGWTSRVANMTSNVLLRSVRMVEDSVAAGLDAVESKLTGKERELFLSEGSVSLLAHRRAAMEALPEWWSAMKRHATLQPDDFTKALEKGSIMEDLLQSSGAIPGKTGEFVRFHLKGLGADDALAKHFVRTDSLYRQIYRKVRQGDKNFTKQAGESAAQATERIFSDLRNNYQSALGGAPQYDFTKLRMWEPLMKEAEEAARKETFQAELGPTAQQGQSFLRNNPIFQIFIPFYRTPVNITKETLRRTPLGFFNTMKNWENMTPAQRTQELSRNITGTLLGTGALAYAMSGGTSGGGPLDPDERAMLEATGWQPYSVRVGNQYISYQRLEPIASIIGVASDAAEAIRNGDFQSAQTGFVRVLQSLGENITNKTFLSGLDALTSAISHPNQAGPQFLKKMQSSLIPNSIGFVPVSGLTRALDPVYRQTEPMSMSTFYSKLPFLSSTLEPQYAPSGEERRRPGTALEQVISPFARVKLQEGPARQGAEEVVRLGASPRAPRKYWLAPGGVRVNFEPEERKVMAQAMQEATRFIGERLMRDPNYIALPENELDPKFSYGRRTKEMVIKDTYSRYRDRVMKRIKPQLVKRGRAQVEAQ